MTGMTAVGLPTMILVDARGVISLVTNAPTELDTAIAQLVH